MTTTELHTLSGAYAIDALTPEEAERFQEHLDACSSCQEEVLELQDAAAQMGASEAIEPPGYLKARVIAAADRQPQVPPTVRHLPQSAPSHKWTPRLLAAAAAVVLVVAAGIGYSATQQEEQGLLAAPVSAVFDAPDARTTTVDTANGGQLEVATSQDLGKMAVDTDELPDLGQEQVYQLWTVGQGGATSAGLVEDIDSGAAMEMPGEGTDVAITIEPAGGSQRPSTKPIVTVTPSDV